MKGRDYLRVEHNNWAGLSSSNIALPDGLYVIPAERAEEQRQPNELPIKWTAGGLLSALLDLALTLLLLAFF